jgi:NDP-sugar pyrophosphorylase family protein
MRALIFAAGRGERMQPLTDTTPKPLLQAGGKRLIEWHLENLGKAGVRDVVINTSHLAEQFHAAFDDAFGTEPLDAELFQLIRRRDGGQFGLGCGDHPLDLFEHFCHDCILHGFVEIATTVQDEHAPAARCAGAGTGSAEGRIAAHGPLSVLRASVADWSKVL